MIAFGPVPSRRLGRSLGINNIPPKVCTCSCVYCQLGCTVKMQVERRAFYQPAEILRDVQDKIERAKEAGELVRERVHRELQSGISARHCRGIQSNIEPGTKNRARSCVKLWKDLFI